MAKVKEACILKQNLMDVSKGTFVLKTVKCHHLNLHYQKALLL